MEETIEFKSEFVEIDETKYTPDFSVVGIYFGEGDPEIDGQHWNFTQSIGDDEDEGVCTVKEVQHAVLYGGISSFTISRNKILCVFDDKGLEETKVRNLVINYLVDDKKWEELLEITKRVFKHESNFRIT